MIEKLLTISTYYHKEIKSLIADIKTYSISIIIGSIVIIILLTINLFFLGKGSVLENYQNIAANLMSIIATFIISLYIPYSDKIRICKKEKKGKKGKILSYYKKRHSSNQLFLDEVEKNYNKICKML